MQILVNKGDFKVSRQKNLFTIQTNKGVSLGFSDEALFELKSLIEFEKPKEYAAYPEAKEDAELISNFLNKKAKEDAELISNFLNKKNG